MPRAPDPLALRRDMLQLRAAADRLELEAASDDLRRRAAPLARAGRLAGSVVQRLAGVAGVAAAERGWLASAVGTLVRRPALASLLAGLLLRLRRRSGRSLGLGLGLGAGTALVLWWLRRSRRSTQSAASAAATESAATAVESDAIAASE